jgi:hypothetical protein
LKVARPVFPKRLEESRKKQAARVRLFCMSRDGSFFFRRPRRITYLTMRMDLSVLAS